ncbi:hypothetical protein BDF14DRAFT_1721608 [Spinellus fusiger]|nr:hypothetical protein BDF14DRAFT_1721608 [Spinellus fusiger]
MKLTFPSKDLRFAWFAGHATLLLSAVIYLLSLLVLRPSGVFYRISLLGAIVSYSIVLFNAHKVNESHVMKRLLLDENTQYWLLAVYFLFSRRISVILLPFAVYSAFHVLQYTRTVLLPVWMPQNPSLQEQIKTLTTTYHQQAIQWITRIELLGVMGRLILGFITTSLFSVLFYGHFLRMRFFMSPAMRKTVAESVAILDHHLLAPTAHPKVPLQVTKAYAFIKTVYNEK